MRMINVLVKQADKEIEDGTILKVSDEGPSGDKVAFEYKFSEGNFRNAKGWSMSGMHSFNEDFLNKEVEFLPPKGKKYLIKVNVRGFPKHLTYICYEKFSEWVMLSSKENSEYLKTHFTKSEMRSIQPVREFLEDMPDKYELIEVEE